MCNPWADLWGWFIPIRFSEQHFKCMNLLQTSHWIISRETVDPRGNNCVMLACSGCNTEINNLELVKFLINRMTHNMIFSDHLFVRNNNMDTILTNACWTNPNLDTIEYLINDIGMEINTVDCENNDCLMIACWKNKNLDIIKFFVEVKKFDLNKRNIKGQNCLIKALIENQNFDVIKYLIEHCNADVNIFDSKGDGFIFHMQNRNILEMVYLIENTNCKLKLGDNRKT